MTSTNIVNTAKTFYAASIFFEILSQFGEVQLDLQLEQKQKYAIWKAADIRKALKEGRKPVPGPPGGDKDLSTTSSGWGSLIIKFNGIVTITASFSLARNCETQLFQSSSRYRVQGSKSGLYETTASFRELQKVYKSYRTRRSLADCAVDVEELWWKALDFAALKRTSMLFFNVDKPKTTVSRWARAQTIAAKAGKELSKDEKAQKLALQHCLEAASPENFLKFFLQYPLYFGSS
ncbi:protein homolog of mammalian lyst-interacting protein 5 [Phtheirospermum japonicum]|uniref:Protein homolog of mammalian lyst-interacting protein 5 n=1 Tax=Phtheirospermum japonicum TaxID=374723 RepID=A0A830BGE6_9LAMI|nr:protein homolog of mammalian lyst-interacting protein 5 [Phtheirospermum japonicum]